MTDKRDLKSALEQLKLGKFLENYEEIASECEARNASHLDFLLALCEQELEHRHTKRLAKLLKAAKLPRTKTLDDFDHKRIPGLKLSQIQLLAQGDFLDRAENLLMFGNPGTGKTHLCLALAQEWCMQGRKVLYTTVATVIQTLLKAKKELALERCIKRYDKYQALIIDDITYGSCERAEADVLFTLLSERYEMRSTIITSNEPFANWNKIFQDETTTNAAIDRLVHHSTILELNAESYRLSTAKKKKQTKENTTKKEVN
jgi:DNA replication protein DnaC